MKNNEKSREFKKNSGKIDIICKKIVYLLWYYRIGLISSISNTKYPPYYLFDFLFVVLLTIDVAIVASCKRKIIHPARIGQSLE